MFESLVLRSALARTKNKKNRRKKLAASVVELQTTNVPSPVSVINPDLKAMKHWKTLRDLAPDTPAMKLVKDTLELTIDLFKLAMASMLSVFVPQLCPGNEAQVGGDDNCTSDPYPHDCFPVEDTRVLTNQGFLFYEEILSREKEILYACYDKRSKSFVYRPGVLVHTRNRHGSLLNFTETTERLRWAEGSSDAGRGLRERVMASARSSHFSLRVTPGHKMFVQRGMKARGSCKVSVKQENKADKPYELYEAEDLFVESCKCDNSQRECAHQLHSIRMLCLVEGGLDPKEQTAQHFQAVAKFLELDSDAKVDAFLQLYGFWLGDGTLGTGRYNQYVKFAQRKEADKTFIIEMLGVLGMNIGTHFTSNTTRSRRLTEFLVKDVKWYWVFYNLYHSKYDPKRECAPKVAFETELPQLVDDSAVVSTTKSAKWLAPWVLTSLSRDQLRLVLEGVRRADGSWSTHAQLIFSSSVSFRDQLINLAIQAGYTAYFEEMYSAGVIRGYQSIPQDGNIYSHVDIVGREEEFKPIISTASNWKIFYNERTPNAILNCQSEITRESHNGYVWCVNVEHCDHIIVAQRAHRDQNGVVTKASRPVVVGNCSFEENFKCLTPLNRWVLAWNFLCLGTLICHYLVVWRRERFMIAHFSESLTRDRLHLRTELSKLPQLGSRLLLHNRIVLVTSIVAIVLQIVNLVLSGVLLFGFYNSGYKTFTTYVTNLLVIATVLYNCYFAAWSGVKHGLGFSAIAFEPVSYNSVQSSSRV
jgi:hypothetical protein